MKGIVFTEFFELVEEKFGYDIVDKIIADSDLPSGGVYTAIGTYDHSEIVQLLMNLSKETNFDPGVLLREFGYHLFKVFKTSYPVFFDKVSNTFEFLASIDNHIHVEVKKLYPDATLPRFETHVDGTTMIMIYKSERSMAALAVGLIEKTIEHFGEDLKVSQENVNDDGSEVRFTISPN